MADLGIPGERPEVPAALSQGAPERSVRVGSIAGPMSSAERFFHAVRLETPVLTACFWFAALLFVVAFWVGPFPPLIDYPQHVAVAALLRRVLFGAGSERVLYDINLITYNGGFHLLVASLSLLMKPETAGKLVLSTYPIALAYAALALVRVAERPRWYALLALPITYSFAVGWGFANYFISVPFAVLAFTFWLRGVRGEKGMGLRIFLMSFLLAYTHVLATLCMCVTIGVGWLFLTLSSRRLPGGGISTALRTGLWLSPAIAWSVFVFFHNRASPHANWEGWDDGLDDPLWYKLLHVLAYAVGNFCDWTDQILLAVAAAVLIAIWRSPAARPSQPLMRALAVTWAALYCIVPKVFIATWFIFERFPTFAVLFAAAAAPVTPERSSVALRRIAALAAVFAGLNTVWHLSRVPGAEDADAILDDIPEGSRVVAVTWANHADPVVLREAWVHVLAYYQARRPGLIAYSFAKFESMPIHYRLEQIPPVIPGGMEWDARKYDPTQPWARFWNTVLVRTPDDHPDVDPGPRTFGAHTSEARLLSHRGRFWLYDASEIAALPPAGVTGGRTR